MVKVVGIDLPYPTRTPTGRWASILQRPDRGRPTTPWLVGPRRLRHIKERWGPGAKCPRFTVPPPPHPTQANPRPISKGGAEATGRLTAATSTPLPTTHVPGQSRWRPEGRRDLLRLSASPSPTPSTSPDPMATGSGPSASPSTHEGMYPVVSLSLSL